VPLTTRLATVADAPAIARIYNQGIEEGLATFETEPRSTAQIEAQLVEKGDRYPTIVVERGGEVLAWAGAGAYRTRGAYAGVAGHSVYTARHARGVGPVGASLLWVGPGGYPAVFWVRGAFHIMAAGAVLTPRGARPREGSTPTSARPTGA
jgi:phosphinothricin acetyltransferase